MTMADSDHGDAVLARPSVTEVLATVVRHGSMSRLMVAERTGLTPPSVTKAVRLLMEAGYLRDQPGSGEQPGNQVKLGRPTMLVALEPGRELFAGINLTGAAVIGTVVDLAGVVQARVHLGCSSRDAREVLVVVRHAVASLRRDLGRRGRRLHSLCLALSGDVDRARGIARYSPFLGWHEVEVAGPASRLTGLISLLDNDVHALTVAELWSGAGLGAQSMALITVGTGVGCGLVVGGEIVRGAFDVAGELGHITIDPNGPECRCGHRGCVEAYVSEEAIVGRLAEVVGRELSLDEAIFLPDTPDVTAVFAGAGHALGRGIATLASLVGPERIVLSPTRPAWFARMRPEMEVAFAAFAYGTARRASLLVRPTGEEDWSRGAAVAAIEARFRVSLSTAS